MSTYQLATQFNLGDYFVEDEYGHSVLCQVTTLPTIENNQVKWRAKIIECNDKLGPQVGEFVDFLITQGYEAYGPRIRRATQDSFE